MMNQKLSQYFTEWYSSRPKILKQNTYFWTVQSRSKYRRWLENKYMNDVIDWLLQIFPEDRVGVDRNNNKVYLDDVRVFYIYISGRHYYKKQNLLYIKGEAKKLIKGD
ncbi:MAG: hypothetical protein QW144_03055 [Candidatus Micrarchaeaceae archaeon]